MCTVTFATDVNSVFDIAWYAFARLLITDVSEKDNYRIFKPKVCKYCGEIFSPNGPDRNIVTKKIILNAVWPGNEKTDRIVMPEKGKQSRTADVLPEMNHRQ